MAAWLLAVVGLMVFKVGFGFWGFGNFKASGTCSRRGLQGFLYVWYIIKPGLGAQSRQVGLSEFCSCPCWAQEDLLWE